MPNIKAEVLANIIADSKTAKNIEGKPNIYTPEEYNKLATLNRAMGVAQGNNDYLESHIKPGQVEFDPNTKMLKKIARNEPKMLPLDVYTANRYIKENIIPANAKKQGHEPGTYILVVLGQAIVNAINNTQELPPTVKAYRFKKVQKEVFVSEGGEEQTVNVDELINDPEGKAAEVADEKQGGVSKEVVTTWEFCGAEFIKNELAYKMTNQLNPEAVLKLRAQIDDNPNPRLSDNVFGDSLDDIA